MASYVIEEADMLKRVRAASSVGVACLVLSFGAGTAYAQTIQPANLGNVENVERGASEPGPHCHFVLPGGGSSGFTIISGAAHEAHTHTPGIFQLATCP